MKASKLCMALVSALLLSACATTTEITSSHKAPTAEPIAHGKKVLALVVAQDPKQRRKAEDELARLMVDATPAYRVFRDAELRDAPLVRRRLAEQGFAYVVAMRAVDVDTDVRSTGPSSLRQDLWEGDRELVWRGETITTTTVRVNTSLYSAADGALIWEAESNTLNPHRADALVDEVAKAAAERLKKDGMMAAK